MIDAGIPSRISGIRQAIALVPAQLIKLYKVRRFTGSNLLTL
jgi:hypothetical protein